MSPARAIPNVGAEEPDPPSERAGRAAATVVELFRSQIERPQPVFDWLPRHDACVAWLNTLDAAEQARAWELALFGAPPEVALRCHDKAFAQSKVRELGLGPAWLRDHVEILAPEDLADVTGTLTRVERALERAEPACGVTLKPRSGTSGRGRVSIRGSHDLERLTGALPRLVRCGGAILEPWFERVQDLAVMLYVAPDGALTLVASAELRVSASGAYRGHRGRIDSRGRISSGAGVDESMREAAVEIARAAADVGYTGPCGIDGFLFRTSDGDRLRPVAELNARFTLGFLMAACVRERLRTIVDDVGLRPDAPVAFSFDFDASLAGPLEDRGNRVRSYPLLALLSGSPTEPSSAPTPAESPGDRDGRRGPVLTVGPDAASVDAFLALRT